MAPGHRLITICFSHYVERARWALDRFGVDYTEEPHMPFLHVPSIWRVHRGRAGRRDKASTRLSTPVLVTPEGRVLTDSRTIVEYVDDSFAPAGQRLYTDTSLATDEQRWHDRLAPHARRLTYAACSRAPKTLPEIARRNVGGWEASVVKHGLWFVERGMARYLDIDDASTERSRQICLRELDDVAARLADGRPYLAGDTFTGWDLSLACFASPLVLPPEYSAWIPDASWFDQPIVGWLDEFRAHPAGQYVLRMFADHRREHIVPQAAL